MFEAIQAKYSDVNVENQKSKNLFDNILQLSVLNFRNFPEEEIKKQKDLFLLIIEYTNEGRFDVEFYKDTFENSKKIKTSIKRFFRKITEILIYIKETREGNIDSFSLNEILHDHIIDIRSLIYALSQYVPNFETEFELLEAEKLKLLVKQKSQNGIQKKCSNQVNSKQSIIENCPQISIHEVAHELNLKDSETTRKLLNSINISPHKRGSKVMVYVQELQLALDLPLAKSLKSKDPLNWEKTFLTLSQNEKTANAIIHKLNTNEESKPYYDKQISSESSKNKFNNI